MTYNFNLFYNYNKLKLNISKIIFDILYSIRHLSVSRAHLKK